MLQAHVRKKIPWQNPDYYGKALAKNSAADLEYLGYSVEVSTASEAKTLGRPWTLLDFAVFDLELCGYSM